MESAGPHARALSIGSPTVAARAIAKRGHRVIAVDYASDAVVETRRCGGPRTLPARADGLALPFRDLSFPFIFSVSAFEHFGSDGDTQAIREVARLLVPGGTAVITVPVTPAYYEKWVDADPYGMQARSDDGRVFFSRYYDERALCARLIEPAGLSLVALHAWQERREGWYASYCARTERAATPGAIATKMLDPYWVRTRIEYLDGGLAALNRHGLAAIVMQKLV